MKLIDIIDSSNVSVWQFPSLFTVELITVAFNKHMQLSLRE